MLDLPALLIACVLAAPQAATPAHQPAAAAPKPAAPAPNPTAPELRTIVGQIVSVDSASGTVVIGESLQSNRPKTAQKVRDTVTLTFDARTQLFRGKRAATREELHPKDHVVVHYVVTPQGARAVTCRISDFVTRTPTPASANPPGTATAAAGTTAGVN